MKITNRMRNRYLKILLRSTLWLGCILVCIIIGWKCCLRKVKNEGNRKSICLYILNKDMDAGEILTEKDVQIQNVYQRDGGLNRLSLQELVGKQVKYALRKDTILSSDLLSITQVTDEGLRKLSYSYIRNADKLVEGDYIDVRIFFPNGADFIILSKKQILKKEYDENGSDKGIWLSVSEEEILRMSSGVVDSYMFDGAYIYATLYMNTLQQEAVVNYPVNAVVEELIKKNPNIVAIAQEKKTLELREKIFEETKEKKGEAQQEEGLVYFD